MHDCNHNETYKTMWHEWFGKPYAFGKELMYSVRMRRRWQGAQATILERDKVQGENLERIIEHSCFAPQRFDSKAEPMSVVCHTFLASVFTLTLEESDTQLKAHQREAAASTLATTEPRGCLWLGANADLQTTGAFMLSFFDRSEQDAALLPRMSRKYLGKLDAMLLKGLLVTEAGAGSHLHAMMAQMRKGRVFFSRNKVVSCSISDQDELSKLAWSVMKEVSVIVKGIPEFVSETLNEQFLENWFEIYVLEQWSMIAFQLEDEDPIARGKGHKEAARLDSFFTRLCAARGRPVHRNVFHVLKDRSVIIYRRDLLGDTDEAKDTFLNEHHTFNVDCWRNGFFEAGASHDLEPVKCHLSWYFACCRSTTECERTLLQVSKVTKATSASLNRQTLDDVVLLRKDGPKKRSDIVESVIVGGKRTLKPSPRCHRSSGIYEAAFGCHWALRRKAPKYKIARSKLKNGTRAKVKALQFKAVRRMVRRAQERRSSHGEKIVFGTELHRFVAKRSLTSEVSTPLGKFKKKKSHQHTEGRLRQGGKNPYEDEVAEQDAKKAKQVALNTTRRGARTCEWNALKRVMFDTSAEEHRKVECCLPVGWTRVTSVYAADVFVVKDFTVVKAYSYSIHSHVLASMTLPFFVSAAVLLGKCVVVPDFFTVLPAAKQDFCITFKGLAKVKVGIWITDNFMRDHHGSSQLANHACSVAKSMATLISSKEDFDVWEARTIAHKAENVKKR